MARTTKIVTGPCETEHKGNDCMIADIYRNGALVKTYHNITDASSSRLFGIYRIDANKVYFR